jgi:predicted nucleic acid-binding protein
MKVLIDSSVWIDHLRGTPTRETATFETLLAGLDPGRSNGAGARLVVADLILCEVLRGIANPRQYAAVRNTMLAFEIVQIGGVEIALRAADHYRALRRLGITLRKTIDLLIGTWCIAEDSALLHSDRDFDPMVQHLGLRAL